MVGRVVADLVVRVHPPADAELLQVLRIALPAEDGRVVRRIAGVRPAVPTCRVDAAAEQVEPVRRGGALDRAVVVVADGERVGQRAVVGDVGLVEVGHRRLGLGRDPAVVRAVRDRLVLGVPVVVERTVVLTVHCERVDVVGQQVVLARHGLVEHVEPVWLHDRRPVAEPANAAHGPVVVVEAPVLLHEDHDVFDVAHRGWPARRGKRLRHAGGQHREPAGRCRATEEPSTGELRHRRSPIRLAGTRSG